MVYSDISCKESFYFFLVCQTIKSFEASKVVAASLLRHAITLIFFEYVRRGTARVVSARFILSRLDFISSVEELRVAPSALALARSLTQCNDACQVALLASGEDTEQLPVGFQMQ